MIGSCNLLEIWLIAKVATVFTVRSTLEICLLATKIGVAWILSAVFRKPDIHMLAGPANRDGTSYQSNFSIALITISANLLAPVSDRLLSSR